jgi:hypothetical protein
MTENTPNLRIYDEAFTVCGKSSGTYISYSLGGDPLVTSLSEEICVNATRFFLKESQESFQEETTTYDGVVGGKL